jgi:hypothetical protein
MWPYKIVITNHYVKTYKGRQSIDSFDPDSMDT